MTPLAGWQNFYVIVGSSAGALIGLQFVVMTLISELPAMRDVEQAGAAFATPNIIHFGSVLLLSAIQCAPWQQIRTAASVWAILGTAGVIYQIVVARNMATQSAYKPVFEDYLFHMILPVSAYALLTATAFFIRWDTNVTLFAVAITTLALLFAGIHNAWDAVTYHVYAVRKKRRNETH